MLQLHWLNRRRLRSYFRDAIWLLPLLGMIYALLLAAGIERVERQLQLTAKANTATALTLLTSMASAMFTFVVFVCSSLLLAVQLASAQLTPRIVGFLFRDAVIRWSMGFFVFTFTFTLAVLVRVNETVPPFSIRIAAYASLASIAIFLYMIGHVGWLLRANGALRSMSVVGRQIIETVYPLEGGAAVNKLTADEVTQGQPSRVVPSRASGVVLAYDTAGLIRLATRHQCIIEVVPQVGEYVPSGDALFRVYGRGDDIPNADLFHSIALGRERTFEQDPAFAIRVIVDIASKALSPAINDPTTAVLALDELHPLLRSLGNRHLDGTVRVDSIGHARLIYHTPDWRYFVDLAVGEIRQYGRDSKQVTERLVMMLQNLIQTLPESRAESLRKELALIAQL